MSGNSSFFYIIPHSRASNSGVGNFSVAQYWKWFVNNTSVPFRLVSNRQVWLTRPGWSINSVMRQRSPQGSDSKCSKRYPIQIFSSAFVSLPQKHHEPLFFTMIRRGCTTCSMKSWLNRKFSATSSSPFGSLQNFHTVCWSVSRKFSKSMYATSRLYASGKSLSKAR